MSHSHSIKRHFFNAISIISHSTSPHRISGQIIRQSNNLSKTCSYIPDTKTSTHINEYMNNETIDNIAHINHFDRLNHLKYDGPIGIVPHADNMKGNIFSAEYG